MQDNQKTDYWSSLSFKWPNSSDIKNGNTYNTNNPNINTNSENIKRNRKYITSNNANRTSCSTATRVDKIIIKMFTNLISIGIT